MGEFMRVSRYGLEMFLRCRREFYWRYVQRVAWPARPLPEREEAMQRRGAQFHQLLERHFLGLAVDAAAVSDVEVGRWWSLFRQSGPSVPQGQALPELSLTVPVGDYLLSGRFDLLVVGQAGDGQATAHIFDWKTGRPQDEESLRQAWQTRLYLALLVEGGGAVATKDGRLDPEHLAITYWYVAEPAAPRTISYSRAWHEQNWAEIEAIVAQIGRLAGSSWPLDAGWAYCRNCAYPVYCGRPDGEEMETAGEQGSWWEEMEGEEIEGLEPEMP